MISITWTGAGIFYSGISVANMQYIAPKCILSISTVSLKNYLKKNNFFPLVRRPHTIM